MILNDVGANLDHDVNGDGARTFTDALDDEPEVVAVHIGGIRVSKGTVQLRLVEGSHLGLILIIKFIFGYQPLAGDDADLVIQGQSNRTGLGVHGAAESDDDGGLAVDGDRRSGRVQRHFSVTGLICAGENGNGSDQATHQSQTEDHGQNFLHTICLLFDSEHIRVRISHRTLVGYSIPMEMVLQVYYIGTTDKCQGGIFGKYEKDVWKRWRNEFSLRSMNCARRAAGAFRCALCEPIEILSPKGDTEMHRRCNS